MKELEDYLDFTRVDENKGLIYFKFNNENNERYIDLYNTLNLMNAYISKVNFLGEEAYLKMFYGPGYSILRWKFPEFIKKVEKEGCLYMGNCNIIPQLIFNVASLEYDFERCKKILDEFGHSYEVEISTSENIIDQRYGEITVTPIICITLIQDSYMYNGDGGSYNSNLEKLKIICSSEDDKIEVLGLTNVFNKYCIKFNGINSKTKEIDKTINSHLSKNGKDFEYKVPNGDMNIILSNDEYSIYFQLTNPKYSFIYLKLFKDGSTRFVVNLSLNFKEIIDFDSFLKSNSRESKNFKENIKLIEECVNKNFGFVVDVDCIKERRFILTFDKDCDNSIDNFVYLLDNDDTNNSNSCSNNNTNIKLKDRINTILNNKFNLTIEDLM